MKGFMRRMYKGRGIYIHAHAIIFVLLLKGNVIMAQVRRISYM